MKFENFKLYFDCCWPRRAILTIPVVTPVFRWKWSLWLSRHQLAGRGDTRGALSIQRWFRHHLWATWLLCLQCVNHCLRLLTTDDSAGDNYRRRAADSCKLQSDTPARLYGASSMEMPRLRMTFNVACMAH